MKLRPYAEVFAMCDLYYRLHWYAVDARFNGRSSEPIKEPIIVMRRKSLEWVLDSSSDWDNVSLDT